MGQDRQAVRSEESQVAGAAYPLADLGLVAYGAGSLQQCGPHGHRGDGCRIGSHPVAAYQRAGRGDRPADRLFGAYRPQHPDLHSGGDQHLPSGRSVGRFLLCGEPYRGDRTEGMGAHSGGREAGRYGQGDRDRYSEDAHRGGVGPQAGAHRLGRREDHRRQRVPPGQGGADRHPRGGQYRRAREPDQAFEGAARFARRGCRTEGAGGHHRVRQDQAG